PEVFRPQSPRGNVMPDSHARHVHAARLHAPAAHEEFGELLTEQDLIAVATEGRVEVADLVDEPAANREVCAERNSLPLFANEWLGAVVENGQCAPQDLAGTLEPRGTRRFPDRIDR